MAETERVEPAGRDIVARLRRILHPLDVLLVAAIVALIAVRLQWSASIVFFSSALAIVPLARLIGVATEELAGRVGSALGGLLNATFGNATELIIAISAMHAGRIELVKASLVGSILGNILAVVGLSFLVGGARRERQMFNRTAAGAAGAQVALAASALLVPTILAATTSARAIAVQRLSVLTAVILLIGYVAGLFFSLRTHTHLYTEEEEEDLHGPRLNVTSAVFVLLAATVAVGVLSQWLVSGVQGVTSGLGLSEIFIGVIIVALVGNAAEHASAVTVAARDKMDLSLSIALGSAAQISLFVAPLLVLVSLLLRHTMTLLFKPFEVAAIAIAAAVVNLVTSDGESTWLEGMQLLAVYAVLAAAFFVYPST